MIERDDEKPERRVELPVLCKFLRCKSGHGAIVNSHDWQRGISPTEAYWCLCTMEAFGPDDDYVHATVSASSARGCYRTET